MTEETKPIPNPPPKNFETNPRFEDKVEEMKGLLREYRGGDPNDVRSTVVDLVTDLMIFCHESEDENGEPLDFDGIVGSAEHHFEAEVGVDDIEACRLLEEGYCDWNDKEDQLVLNEKAESTT